MPILSNFPSGATGPSGSDGAPGKSAYQAAKEAGYKGTEQEFNTTLSLAPTHIANKDNPHKVTLEQIGAAATDLSNVPNDVFVQKASAAGVVSDVFSVGTSAPKNTKLLWIDTTQTTGGLKYYNGSSWVHVPVAFT